MEKKNSIQAHVKILFKQYLNDKCLKIIDKKKKPVRNEVVSPNKDASIISDTQKKHIFRDKSEYLGKASLQNGSKLEIIHTNAPGN